MSRGQSITRRDFLAATASAPLLLAQRPASPRFMYIGSFTGEGRGRGEGLSVYDRSGAGGGWTRIQLLDKIGDPSFLVIHRNGRFLYSSHGGLTHATSYQIDQSTGRLTVLNQQPTNGTNGAHLAIDGTGRFVAVANYASGSLAVLPINVDGTLGPVSDLAQMQGEPGPHRTQQTSSHPHHCPFDRTGRYIVVPDKGFDRTFVFRLDAANGKLVPATPPSVVSRPGAAPRHVDFHPLQPYAYVINELDSTIAAYHFDPEKGVLKPFQVITTLPSSHTGNNSTAEIWVAPSGRFLYSSNRGHDSVAIFAINAANGELTHAGWESTQGRTPRYFGLDPAGIQLYAANQNSDTVVIFDVNQTTGKLTPANQVVNVASPSAIVFK